MGGGWAPAFGAPVVVVPSPMREYKADTSYTLCRECDYTFVSKYSDCFADSLIHCLSITPNLFSISNHMSHI